MKLPHATLALALALAVPAAGRDAPPPSAPGAPAPEASPDFPAGTATPSAVCGACHQAIHREYADGFGSDMRDPAVKLRAKADAPLRMPAGTSAGASAHAVAGTDPWPKQADEQGLHEASVRAGKERVLHWAPALRPGAYTVEATLVYDLNRYNDRSFQDDLREIGRRQLPLRVLAGR